MNKTIISILFFLYNIFSFSYADVLQNNFDTKSKTGIEQDYRFLSLEKAFQFSGKINGQNEIVIAIKIAPDYYLYRDQLHFFIKEDNKMKEININLPFGININDPFKNEVLEIFDHSFKVSFPYDVQKELPKIYVHFQGCGRKGICYPLSETSFLLENSHLPSVDMPEKNTFKSILIPSSDDNYFSLLNTNQQYWFVLLCFFVAGVLLSLTPCVLPMVPILSATLAQAQNRQKILFMTMSYILSMSMTYAIVGALVGYLGTQVTPYLQSPWIIYLSALFFVFLGGAMMDWYTLQLPSFINAIFFKMDGWIVKKYDYSFVRAGCMGVFSALIVSPCLTAPIAGALLYISTTKDILLGGMALFCFGLGIGMPLLIVGLGMKKFLPKQGPFMEDIKRIFGILMFGIAVWLFVRFYDDSTQLIIWGASFFFLAIYCFYCYRMIKEKRLRMISNGLIILSFVFLLYSALLVIGGLRGGYSMLNPLARHPFSMVTNKSPFIVVKSVKDFDVVIQKSIQQKRPAIVVFSADWCEICHQLENNIFLNSEIIPLFSDFNVIKFDVTHISLPISKIMKKMHIFGTPVTILYNKEGKEIARRSGNMSKKYFKTMITRPFKTSSQSVIMNKN